MKNCLLLVIALVLPPFSPAAQLPDAGEGGVAMGHLHLLVRDPDTHRRLWVEGFGARPVQLGPMEALLLPDVVVLLRKGEPAGGTEGSSVNHLGFLVRDRAAFEKRWLELGGEIYERRPSPTQVFLRLPDDIKVEMTEDTSLDVPIRHHHIHFFTSSVDDTKAWYVETFAARPGRRGKFEAADLPGVNLSFSEAATPSTGTKGRGVDHIGFEIDGLEAYCKKLEARGVKFDVPYRYVPNLGVSIAFFTDPWGTYVELTEGLDKLK